MTAVRLVMRRVEKPWGRRDLLAPFGDVPPVGAPVGEIWFEDPRGGNPELLVKYLFTSEKLSVQVHPDDAAAQARGHARGKEEAWLVLEAEPEAVIGLGLKTRVTSDELRAAALDGRIEELIDWRPAAPGDYYYSPAGTVHALGPGLKLIEIQQNVDLTYRLYDYGRPRDLHVEEAVAVADPVPYEPPFEPYALGERRTILAEGRKFVLERWTGPVSAQPVGVPDTALWLVPVEGEGTLEGAALEPGTVWIAEGHAELELAKGAVLLVAYPGAEMRSDLLN